MLQGLNAPYVRQPYNQALHDVCVKQAIERGFPMATDESSISLRKYIPVGVVIASTAYGHLAAKNIHTFIALYTALMTCMDDVYANSTSESLKMFLERFSRGEKQLDPLLDAAAQIFQEIPEHYDAPVSGMILSSSVEFMNAMTLESEVEGMSVSI